MFYITPEGSELKPGINFYPLNKNESYVGFRLYSLKRKASFAWFRYSLKKKTIYYEYFTKTGEYINHVFSFKGK